MNQPCTHSPVRVSVQLAGRTIVMHRCAPCDVSWWTEDDRPARRRAVYAAVGGDAPRILRTRGVVGRLARRRSTAGARPPMAEG